MKKLLSWVSVNLVSVLAIVQVIVKFVKEVLTAIVNILFPIIPSASFKGVVQAVRGIVNKVDEVLEKIKEQLLKVLPK